MIGVYIRRPWQAFCEPVANRHSLGLLEGLPECHEGFVGVINRVGHTDANETHDAGGEDDIGHEGRRAYQPVEIFVGAHRSQDAVDGLGADVIGGDAGADEAEGSCRTWSAMASTAIEAMEIETVNRRNTEEWTDDAGGTNAVKTVNVKESSIMVPPGLFC